MNTTKKKIIATLLIGIFLLSPVLVLSMIFYANILYVIMSLTIWFVILLVNKFEDLKTSGWDPENNLYSGLFFSGVFKVLLFLGILMQYAFLAWVFKKDSEITFKKEAIKQIEKHQDRIDKCVKSYSIKAK